MKDNKLIKVLLKRKSKAVKNSKKITRCPDDLLKWILKNEIVLGYLYDVDLLPEQIYTKKQVCALRGFYYGWNAAMIAKTRSPEEVAKLILKNGIVL